MIALERVRNPDGTEGVVTDRTATQIRVRWDDGTVNRWDADDPSVVAVDCFRQVSRGTPGALTGASHCGCAFPSGACALE